MNDPRFFPATLMPDRDWWTALWPDPEAVLLDTGLEPVMRAVDLCCGDGHFTAPLCRLVRGPVWALDLDPELLAETRKRCRDHPDLRALRGDAMDLLRWIETPVDFVFMANTFHGVPDRTGLAGVVSEALAPGGRFVVVNWCPRPREETRVLGLPRGPDTALRMPPDEVVRVVDPSGLRLERVVDVGPYHYGAVFRKP